MVRHRRESQSAWTTSRRIKPTTSSGGLSDRLACRHDSSADLIKTVLHFRCLRIAKSSSGDLLLFVRGSCLIRDPH
jgi:hypothetical protein